MDKLDNYNGEILASQSKTSNYIITSSMVCAAVLVILTLLNDGKKSNLYEIDEENHSPKIEIYDWNLWEINTENKPIIRTLDNGEKIISYVKDGVLKMFKIEGINVFQNIVIEKAIAGVPISGIAYLKNNIGRRFYTDQNGVARFEK